MSFAIKLRVEFQLPVVFQSEGIVAIEYQHRFVVSDMALACCLARVVEIKREPLLLHSHCIARGPHSHCGRYIHKSTEHVDGTVEVNHTYHHHSIVVVWRCPVVYGILDMQVVDIEGYPFPSSRKVEGVAYLVFQQRITRLQCVFAAIVDFASQLIVGRACGLYAIA